tara:strand:- start:578 stop:1423 length:846 start_codon:yes stop_codon:yes gene_type:complete
MASLIKTNKISTPGGEEFTLPTTLPASQSSLTSTSGGVLGYGDLGFATDRLENASGDISRVFVDKLRATQASPLSNMTLDVVPSGTDADNVQDIWINCSGVCLAADGFLGLEFLDASNNNVLSSSTQMRFRVYHAIGGSNVAHQQYSNQSWNEHRLCHSSYDVPGASASSEIFTATTLANERPVFNMEARIVIISANQANPVEDGSVNGGTGGRMIVSAYSSWARGNYDSASRGAATWSNSVWHYSTFNQIAKVKLFDYSGSSSFNEGLAWSEVSLNSLKV